MKGTLCFFPATNIRAFKDLFNVSLIAGIHMDEVSASD